MTKEEIVNSLGDNWKSELGYFASTVVGNRRMLWERAFTMYTMEKGEPLSMFCIPCYFKVWNFLKENDGNR